MQGGGWRRTRKRRRHTSNRGANNGWPRSAATAQAPAIAQPAADIAAAWNTAFPEAGLRQRSSTSRTAAA